MSQPGWSSFPHLLVNKQFNNIGHFGQNSSKWDVIGATGTLFTLNWEVASGTLWPMLSCGKQVRNGIAIHWYSPQYAVCLVSQRAILHQFMKHCNPDRKVQQIGPWWPFLEHCKGCMWRTRSDFCSVLPAFWFSTHRSTRSVNCQLFLDFWLLHTCFHVDELLFGQSRWQKAQGADLSLLRTACRSLFHNKGV